MPPSPAAVARECKDGEPAMEKAVVVTEEEAVMESEAVMEAMVKRKSIEMRATETAPHMRRHAAMEAAAKAWTTAHATAAKMRAAATHAAAAKMHAATAAVAAERSSAARPNHRDAESDSRRYADDLPPHETFLLRVWRRRPAILTTYAF